MIRIGDFRMEEAIINSLDTNKKTCFIITPIGKEHDPIRRHIDGVIKAVIEPVLEENDYEPIVPHYMTTPGSIDKQIIKQIYKSDLVIANLTSVNPNVMYELALRHCFGTPIIIIAEEGTVLPFDIGNQRTIFYHNDAMGVLVLADDLSKAIKKLSDDGAYESPVISVVKELGIEEIIIKDKTISSDKNEANAWSILFERLDRIEQKVSSPKKPEIIDRILTEKNYEVEMIISGEQEISYKVRDSIRLLLNSMRIDYKIERNSDDTQMTVSMDRMPRKNWKYYSSTVTDICKAHNLSLEIRDNRYVNP